MQTEHTFKQYDAELEAVRAKVLEMGGLVEQQIVSALEALVKADSKLAKEVMHNDHRVNNLEIQIDEDCSHIIARRQPAAGDLRTVMMIVKTMIKLAHGLGKRILAEGVETAVQLELLRNMSCDAVQGYYIAKPLAEEDALALVKQPTIPLS